MIDLIIIMMMMMMIVDSFCIYCLFVYIYIGMILWQLFTREEPFQGLSTKQIYAGVVEEDIHPPIPIAPFVFTKLIQVCWATNPELRPPFEKIVKILAQPLQSLMEYTPPSSSFSSTPVAVAQTKQQQPNQPEPHHQQPQQQQRAALPSRQRMFVSPHSLICSILPLLSLFLFLLF